jgi:aspartate kinase
MKDHEMARIVMKFGGTSVATTERIKIVAEKVKAEVDSGNEVAVVVSAMSGTTNQLIDWTRDVGAMHDAREYDVVVSSGEQVTIGLLAIALQNLGIDARSWLGWQVAMHTDSVHGGAHIESIDVDEISARFEHGQVAVMAGFQGIAENNRITTLGRGGSDTTAVALAAVLGADRCDIYTDVIGVYTADPGIVPKATKLDTITFEEMLEMASGGAKVLQTRSVALAMRHNVALQVLSSFDNLPGTMVVREEEKMEKSSVSGIAYSADEAKVTLAGLVDKPGIAAKVFSSLADHNVNVDMIVQTAASTEGRTDITFSVGGGDLERAQKVLESVHDEIDYQDMLTSESVCKISVVGVAMRSQPGIAKTMFETLADKGINIEVISTSEIKISVLIAREYTELAVRSLHTAFGLDEGQ